MQPEGFPPLERNKVQRLPRSLVQPRYQRQNSSLWGQPQTLSRSPPTGSLYSMSRGYQPLNWRRWDGRPTLTGIGHGFVAVYRRLKLRPGEICWLHESGMLILAIEPLRGRTQI